MTPQQMEEERKKRIAASRQKIAQSNASATPIQSGSAPLQAGQIQQQQNPLKQIGMQLGKQALGSALGPLGGLLGGLFNNGGKIDYAEEARKRVAKQNAALKAGAQGHSNAPLKRQVFVDQAGGGFKDTGETVDANVVKGYANRKKQGQTAGLQDTYAGIAQQIQAAQAAGKPVDYNALAALQQARQSGNAQKEAEAMRMFLQKHPNFRMPGGSQAVVKRNMGGPISRNPHGYNEGGATMETPLKKVMDEDKIEMAREAFQRAEARKDQKAAADERRAQETHQQAMKMKKASATTNKAPLAKKS